MNQDKSERPRTERIQHRAYELYQSRGSFDGLDEDDWLQAEREIDGAPTHDDAIPAPDEASREENS